MAEREKVIKALQICSVQNDVGCQGCPYFEERKTYGHEWCTTSMAQDALAMLKEQEAVEHEWVYKHDNLWYCSRCGEIIYSETDEDLAVHHAYCSRCGTKMKQEGR